jgi:ABC-2 type transport system permease protein
MRARVVLANLYVKLICVYREKSTMFFTLAFPIILILLFGAIFMSQDNVNFHLCVQDLDQSKSSRESVEALGQSGKFKLTAVAPGVDAVAYLRETKATLVLVIPKGFERSLMRRKFFQEYGETAVLTYVYDPSSSSVPTKMAILSGVIAGANQQISGIPPFLKTVEKSILTRQYRFIEYFIPGIIAMSVMTLSLFGTANLNTELRQKGIIRKLSTTPITRTEWILSDVLYFFIIALVTTTLMLAVSWAVFRANLHLNAWLPAFLLLDVFAFVGIGMTLTRFIKESQSAAAAANAISFPMMFLSGSFFPVELMPGFLQALAKTLPLYYVNEGLRAAMIFQDNAGAGHAAAVIGVFAAVVFILGIMATRWEERQ